jgi:hypothetical protein
MVCFGNSICLRLEINPVQTYSTMKPENARVGAYCFLQTEAVGTKSSDFGRFILQNRMIFLQRLLPKARRCLMVMANPKPI